MKDVQNTIGDYLYKINKVGVKDVKAPILVKNQDGKIVNTVGNFDLNCSLERNLKGSNMSRFTIFIDELVRNGFVFTNFREDFKALLEGLAVKLESKDSYIDLRFTYFMDKIAPVSKVSGIMPYEISIKASLVNDEYDFKLNVEVPVTTLCPCSKEISDYSAHNQRGFVNLTLGLDEYIDIEEIINEMSEIGSCEIYSVLKRVDEKYVTEKAYNNPRFVEDIVRSLAQKYYDDSRVNYILVSSTHQESIHPHDAYAEIEISKK